MRLELPVLLSPRLGQIVRIVIDADAPGDFAADQKTNGVAKFSGVYQKYAMWAPTAKSSSRRPSGRLLSMHTRVDVSAFVETQRMTPDAE